MATQTSQHTPGPWIAEENAHRGATETYIVAPGSKGGTFIAMVPRAHAGNARLIAAAPEMRWLIERLWTALDFATRTAPAEAMRGQGYTALINEAVALLARIEGGA